MKFDLILRGGKIADGTGTPGYVADIGLINQAIASIGNLGDAAADIVIDAAGKWVTPGFIDMHSHADLNVPIFPDMKALLGQGITTVFTGHCGLGVTPVNRYWHNTNAEDRAIEQVIPLYLGGPMPYLSQIVETDLLRPAYLKAYGVELDWSDWRGFASHLNNVGIGVNMVGVVGHANIRTQVMGLDYQRKATAEEIHKMGQYLTEAMEQGAWGFSFGLDYSPDYYADTDELAQLARCVQPYHGVVTAHVQNGKSRFGITDNNHKPIDGVKEFLEIGLAANVHVHISHVINGYAGFLPPDERIEAAGAQAVLSMIQEYRAKGVHVTWDVLPDYNYGIFHFPHLLNYVMPYVDLCGGAANFSRCLNTGSYKLDLATEIKAGRHISTSIMSRIDPSLRPDWDKALRIIRCADEQYVGMTLREIALLNKKNSVDMLLDLLQIDIFTCAVRDKAVMSPTLRTFISSSDAALGLDIKTGSYDQVYQKGDLPPTYIGGPTEYGGMIRFLEDCNFMAFEDLIARMTGNGAKMIGLDKRGLLCEGYAADILVIDRNTIKSRYNFIDPRQLPSGLDYVIVNGTIVRDHDALFDLRAGTVLLPTHKL